MTKPLNTFNEYSTAVWDAMNNINQSNIDSAIGALVSAYYYKNNIFVCGNGGSAAIADHLTCDVMKGVATDSIDGKTLHVNSLCCNSPLTTAIANDIGYDQVFSKQLEWQAEPFDVLIAISSSGNSPNIINAIKTAKKKYVTVISITGFDGGEAATLANHSIHINSDNYGVVEDVSQSIMHYIAQTLRRMRSNKNPEDIKY